MRLEMSEAKKKDLFHYVIVYGALLAYWPWGMATFGNNTALTAFAGLVVFMLSDKLAHRFILGE